MPFMHVLHSIHTTFKICIIMQRYPILRSCNLLIPLWSRHLKIFWESFFYPNTWRNPFDYVNRSNFWICNKENQIQRYLTGYKENVNVHYEYRLMSRVNINVQEETCRIHKGLKQAFHGIDLRIHTRSIPIWFTMSILARDIYDLLWIWNEYNWRYLISSEVK